jgi:hypothetical protein
MLIVSATLYFCGFSVILFSNQNHSCVSLIVNQLFSSLCKCLVSFPWAIVEMKKLYLYLPVIQLGTSLRTLAHLFLKETKHLHKEEKS